MNQDSNAKGKITLEQRKNLIEAYRTLHDSVYRRESNVNTLNAILLPASIVLIGIAVQYKDNLNALFPSEIHVAGFVPLFSALLLFSSSFTAYRIKQVNKVCYEKIQYIEETLGIEGHTYIYSQIKDKWWWKTRSIVWWTLLVLFLAVCFISSYLLFR